MMSESVMDIKQRLLQKFNGLRNNNFQTQNSHNDKRSSNSNGDRQNRFAIQKQSWWFTVWSSKLCLKQYELLQVWPA